MLATESINIKSKNIDTKSTLDILKIINSEDQSVAVAVAKALPEISALIDAVSEILKKGGRLFYVGAGTSGRLGVLDASECPPTFGVPSSMVVGVIAGGDTALRNSVENAEDNRLQGEIDLRNKNLSAKDAVIGISAAGAAPYVLGAIEYATAVGAVTGCIVCNEDTPLVESVKFPISVVVGPEIIQGSTRMKAGTAEKMVLNMITTVSMIKLGFVYDNLMVNLQPTNLKLEKRAQQIIKEITGCDDSSALSYYNKSGRRVPEAVLMLQFDLGKEEAAIILSEAGGNLHNAISICEANNYKKNSV